MHQPLFIIYAFFKGNHGFRTTDSIDIVDPKDNVLGMIGIFRPNLAKDIEFTRSDMCNSYVWNLLQSL